MNFETVFEKHTDFISDYQNVLAWGFNSEDLTRSCETNDYSAPVRRAFLKGCMDLAQSGDRRKRERSFTVWMGDYGNGNTLFWLAIPAKTSAGVCSVLGKRLESLTGFYAMEFGAIPSFPLIPMYRYEKGQVVEYCSSDSQAGKTRIDDENGLGTMCKILYRRWASAEGLDMKECYRG